jgi:hypothetical protein
MIHQLDYSSLEARLNGADIAAYKQSGNHVTFIRSINKEAIGFMVLLTTVSVIAGRGSLQSFFVPFAVIAPTLLIWWVTYRNNMLHRARIYTFAIRNGVRMVSSVHPEYAGMIFNNGESGQIVEALQFNDGTEIGNYDRMKNTGSRRMNDVWAYVKIKLVRSLPHMVLDAKANNALKISNLEQSFDRSQILGLEGNFNEYFTLYVPKQYGRDALYVFTPDVMAAMIDSGRQYDIEIVGDELYMYSQGSFLLDAPETYKALFKIINTIHQELVNQIDYYADEKVGDRTKNSIALGGNNFDRD